MTARSDRPNPVRDEIDGSSDPEERAELAGMIELGSLLSRIEPVEPPPELAPAVMRAVRNAQARDRQTLWGKIRSVWPDGRAVLPYAYAAAAGAALCFVSIQVLTGAPLLGDAVRDRDARGTMTGRSIDPPVARLDLSGVGVHGAASVRESRGNAAVDLVFEKADGLRLSVGFDPDRVRFVGISDPSAGLDQVNVGPGSIQWEQHGPRQVTLILARVGSDPTPVDIRWSDAAGHEGGGALTVPPSR